MTVKKKVKKNKNIQSGAKAPSAIEYKDYYIEVTYADKKKYSITSHMLEKLWNNSLNMGKKPLLRIGIKKSDSEMFILSCELDINKI